MVSLRIAAAIVLIAAPCGAQTIDSLPDAGAVSTTANHLPITQNGSTKKITPNALFGVPPSLVVNNLAALRALSPGIVSALTRNGYTAAGDAPPITYVWAATCPGAIDNRAKYINPNVASTGCWSAAGQPELADPREWGADPAGVADSTAAIQALFTAAGGGTVTMDGGPFTYLMTSPVTNTLTAANSRLVIEPGSTYKWNSLTGGFNFTIATPEGTNSLCYTGAVNIGKIDIVATQANAGTGLAVTATTTCAAANSAPMSYIAARIHGDYETTYWTTGAILTGLSDVDLKGSFFHGRASNLFAGPGPAGVGLKIVGQDTTHHSAGFYLTDTVFTGLSTGFWISDFTEGIKVTASDFQAFNGGCGILVQDSGGDGVQIANSQIGLVAAAGTAPICVFGAIANLNIADNLLINMNGNADIYITAVALTTTSITGNQFQPFDTTPANGIYTDHTSGNLLVASNYFSNYGTGINVHGANSEVDLRSNDNYNLSAINVGHEQASVLVTNGGGGFGIHFPEIMDIRAFGAACDSTSPGVGTDDTLAFVAADAMHGINRIGVNSTCRVSQNAVTITHPLAIGSIGQISLDNALGMFVNRVDIDNQSSNPFPGSGTIAAVAGGAIFYPTMPTSCAARPSGTIWIDTTAANTLKVC